MDLFRSQNDVSAVSKLDAFMNIVRADDQRVVPFLLDVLTDAQQPTQVRVHVLKRVRDQALIRGHRESVAKAFLRLAAYENHPQLRLGAILALAEFTDIDGVESVLGALALDRDLHLDVRYSAFTSLERAGPTAESIPTIRQLLSDDTLGPAARSLLLSWWISLFLV